MNESFMMTLNKRKHQAIEKGDVILESVGGQNIRLEVVEIVSIRPGEEKTEIDIMVVEILDGT